MVGASLKPRILSSFVGERLIQSRQPLSQLFLYNPGHKCVSMQLSRTFSGLINLLFNRRTNFDEVQNSKHKCLRPGKLSPRQPVPDHIQWPSCVKTQMVPGMADGPEVHDLKGIECMRASGRLAAQVFSYAGTLAKPGITTDEIDRAVHQMIMITEHILHLLDMVDFQKVSVNECICHGIPDSHPVEDGDIINIDVTVYLNGYHGDTAATFFVEMMMRKQRILCSDHADKFGYGVVQRFAGHGIGQVFHADPVVLHFRNNDGGRMVLNQTFTIVGSINPVRWDDNWTEVTDDGSLSAQFEHTSLITEDGAEILTQRED